MDISQLIQAIQNSAIARWGTWGWKAALTEEYQQLLEKNGVEQEFNTCRSTINRVFKTRSCNADTLYWLATASGCQLSITTS